MEPYYVTCDYCGESFQIDPESTLEHECPECGTMYEEDD